MDKAIEISAGEKYTLLKILFKECNIYNTTALSKNAEEAITAISTPFVIIDFSQVLFIDSSGIGTVVHIKKNLTIKNIEMICTGLNENVMQVFRITKTEALFKIFKSLDEGIKYIESNL